MTANGEARVSECLYHPAPKYRECHHSGTAYVAVWWDGGMGDWISTYGHLDRRGSMSAFASKELDYMLSLLREEREEVSRDR